MSIHFFVPNWALLIASGLVLGFAVGFGFACWVAGKGMRGMWG